MAERERAYAIGDFHLGAGDDLEGFDQDDEFGRFIDAITDEHTTLFLNGDFVDFAQIPPFDTAEPEHLLWTQDASVEKMAKATVAHAACFEALARFLEGGGTLRMLTGNHDFDLAWPAIQERFTTRLAPSDPGRLTFTNGYERYHGVHIQHGFHFCAENSPVDPDRFIHQWPESDGRQYLERVWGTDFLLQFFNDIEREYPFAANVKPHVRLMVDGIRKRWIGGHEVVRLARFLKRRGVPWRAVAAATLGDDIAPAAISASAAARHVVDAFADHDWKRMISAAIDDDEELRDQVTNAVRSLPPDDLTLLRMPTPVPDAPPVRAAVSATADGYHDARDQRAARELLSAEVTHVVFGHTHHVVDAAETGLAYTNPGTWLPRLDLRSERVRQSIEHGITLEVLQDESLYVAQRLAVRIVPAASGPSEVSLEQFT